MLGYCQLLTNIIVNSRSNVIKDSFTGVTNGKINKIAYNSSDHGPFLTDCEGTKLDNLNKRPNPMN